MVRCIRCKSVVDDTRVDVCPKCGAPLSLGTVITSKDDLKEKPSAKKVFRMIGLIAAGVGTAIGIIVYLLSFFGITIDTLHGNNRSRIDVPEFDSADYDAFIKSENEEAKRFIEKLEDYQPGYVEDGKYVSEFFGFSYDVNELVIYEKSDYAAMEEDAYNSAVNTTRKTLEKYDIDEKHVELVLESVYGKYEFVGGMQKDASAFGEIAIAVCSSYSGDDPSQNLLDSLADGIVVRYTAMGVTDIEKSETTFANIDCYRISGNNTIDGVDCKINTYIYYKDYMFGSITIKDFGTTDALNRHFLDNVEKY